MATSRNVWLPGAAVWACWPHASELPSSPARDQTLRKGKNARFHDGELHVEIPRKRLKGASPRTPSDCSPEIENRTETLARMNAEADAPALGLLIGSKEGAMCPICLCTIEEAGGAILQWCMHQFCAHCIEEWSQVRRLCPLCKAEYRGWYHDVQSNSKFRVRILPPIAESSNRGDTAASHAHPRFHVWRDSRRQERGRERIPPRRQGIVPGKATSSSGRSMPFPTQRSFGLPKEHQGAQAMRVLEEQAATKALKWRQSIYNRDLKARPFELRRKSTGSKDERAERRLVPWIRRELEAVLPNSDHNLLVRFVLGLWLGAEHEAIHRPERLGRSDGPSTGTSTGSTEAEGAEEKSIKELKRFLGDNAELFWHELRCFAESPFTMRAYDTVVVYNRHDHSRRPTSRVERRSSHQDRSRRRSESTSIRLLNEGAAPLQINQQIHRVARLPTSLRCAAGGVHGSSDSSRDYSQGLLNRNPQADQRKKSQHVDVIPIAEHRWQLSYC